MTQYLIMCRSLTKAQSSARLLESAGITASVVKAPQELSGAGCGYALSLYRTLEEAVELLRKNKLLNGKLYSRSGNNAYVEVKQGFIWTTLPQHYQNPSPWSGQ